MALLVNLSNPLSKISGNNLPSFVERLVSSGIAQINSEPPVQEKNIATSQEIDDLRGLQYYTYSAEIDRALDVEGAKDTETGYENLAYPSDLNKFYMRMDFKKYQRPSPTLPATINTLHSVCFPIPTDLSDNYRIDYSDFDAEIAGAIMNSLQNTNQGITASAAIQPLLRFISGSTIGRNFVNIGAQTLAAALNPNKSIIFNSPQFKNYSFSWTFAPNNAEESETLRKIIKKIKASSLPTYSVSTNANGDLAKDYNVFNYPNMVKVSLYPWASQEETTRDMFQTKHCVIDSISVNYSPENNISFFNGEKNAPTFIALTLNLIEIELFTGEDFGREGEKVDLNRIIDITKMGQDNQIQISEENIDPFVPANTANTANTSSVVSSNATAPIIPFDMNSI
jgi:hypothetical protein